MSEPYDLLPCPFCGEEQPPHDTSSWVRCRGCGAETGLYVDGPAAASAWNRRDGTATIDAAIRLAIGEAAKVAFEAGWNAYAEMAVYGYQPYLTDVEAACADVVRALADDPAFLEKIRWK